MATQNLFEKYGIKDVADVTFYRIEKKEETYEAQRTIDTASILKGAVELRTVYPIISGKSTDEGFDAYVFTNAEVLTGANYDCDDEGTLVTRTLTGTVPITGTQVPDSDPAVYELTQENIDAAIATLKGTLDPTGATLSPEDAEPAEDATWTAWNVTLETEGVTIVEGENSIAYTATSTTVVDGSDDATTGVALNGASTAISADADKFPGTHEYSYAEQAFMLFAKRQNLIGTTGTRYRFQDVDDLMGTLAFEDRYALAPNSTERVVVLGSAAGLNTTSTDASWSDADYDVSEVNELLNALSTSYTAKAYNVVYNLYAELVVEDEMGYYNPNFLGTGYDKGNKVIINTGVGVEPTSDTDGSGYLGYAASGNKGIDRALANAVMWGENVHFSINDAIAALRQQKLILDADSTSAEGISKVYGGYKVSSTLGDGSAISAVGTDDGSGNYTYYDPSGNGGSIANSQYSLEKVIDALNALAYRDGLDGKEVAVDSEKFSNRAIYVDVSGANVAASSYIYLLHNKNYRKLASDTEGIFTFTDKKGNKVYYQDKIFAKTEWLALVIVGNKGFIFVVNRNGTKDISRIAWMVTDNDFITDKQAKSLVANGLIHTTDITVNDETFEATCAVKGLSVRKTVKKVNHYTPVLFLDTLKVSTIEQTAEEAYATGGHGNANLIGWDFGKAITLSLEDALFTPASFSASLGAYEGDDFRKGVKETKQIDRIEKVIAKRSFIVPAGNQNGTPTEADKTAQAVFIDPNTMEPYADGTPIAEGEIFLKYTRSIAYEGQSIGHTIEISADKFPGTYKIVGDTFIKNKDTGREERFQFTIPQAKMNSERTITLEADGDPVVFDMELTVLRPDDGVMVRFIQYNVVENEEENDGSTMVVGTENLNLLDDAELYKVSGTNEDSESYIGATEY